MAQVYEDPSGGGGGGNWSFREAAAKGIAGTIGIMTALIVDYIQKGNDSAVLFATRMINQAAISRFQLEAVPPYIYLAVLVVAGFALVYIFEPTNKRNAFYAGAGVLGFLATFSPVLQETLQIPQGGALPSLESILSATDSAPVTPETMEPATPQSVVPGAEPINGQPFNDLGLPIVRAVYRPVQPGNKVVQVQNGVAVNVVIQFPGSAGGKIPQVRAWLHDTLTNRTMTLGAGAKLARTTSGTVIVYQTIITTTPQGSTLADLAVRVEADGYKITTVTATITQSTPLPVRIDVDLEASNTPLAIQRLQYPYKW